jgi:hypothetical protein
MVNGAGTDSFSAAMFSLLAARTAAKMQEQAALALLESAAQVQQAAQQAVEQLSETSGIDIYV